MGAHQWSPPVVAAFIAAASTLVIAERAHRAKVRADRERQKAEDRKPLYVKIINDDPDVEASIIAGLASDRVETLWYAHKQTKEKSDREALVNQIREENRASRSYESQVRRLMVIRACFITALVVAMLSFTLAAYARIRPNDPPVLWAREHGLAHIVGGKKGDRAITRRQPQKAPTPVPTPSPTAGRHSPPGSGGTNTAPDAQPHRRDHPDPTPCGTPRSPCQRGGSPTPVAPSLGATVARLGGAITGLLDHSGSVQPGVSNVPPAGSAVGRTTDQAPTP